MINEVIVRILAERILNKGVNPLKNIEMKLEHIANIDYRNAVEDYIISSSGVIEGDRETSAI